jgi:hypothetical protein
MKNGLIAYTILALSLCGGPASGRLKEEAPDSISSKSAGKADSLETQNKRNALGRLLSDHLLAAKIDTAQVGQRSVRSEDQYMAYKGRFIRKIEIYRYNIFSDTEVGSKSPGGNPLIRAIEWTHIDTRRSKVASYLLFRKGDPVDPQAISDSERILRETSFIHEANIRLVPVEGSADSVDVQVLTRDVWSLGVNVTFITKDKYRARLFEKNFLGYGHTIRWETALDFDRDRLADHAFYYGATNIFGTFIDGEVRIVDAAAYNQNRWRLNRPYISPRINWIGGASLDGMDDFDENLLKTRKWNREDAWIGRSIPVGKRIAGGSGRMRLIPAVRVTRTDYQVRPPVGQDLNRSFYDRTVYLGSISLTERAFQKTRLVFSFGRTEDIPYGFLASLTGGVGASEFFNRPYAAVDLAYADFFGSSAYYTVRCAVGSYARNDRPEDGTFSLRLGSFTSLLPGWHAVARNFFVIDYIYGFNRLPSDEIALDQPTGDLAGLSRTGIEGHERLILKWEGVLFADWDWYGFRFASFGYAQSGQAGPEWDSFVHGKYYFSLGGGFRAHNERLIFDAYEIRFMFHPVVPEGADTSWLKFEAVKNLSIPFLSPSAPRVVAYE